GANGMGPQPQARACFGRSLRIGHLADRLLADLPLGSWTELMPAQGAVPPDHRFQEEISGRGAVARRAGPWHAKQAGQRGGGLMSAEDPSHSGGRGRSQCYAWQQLALASCHILTLF